MSEVNTINQSPAPTYTSGTVRVSLVQMCSSRDVDENLATIADATRAAAADGAQYVQTPEVSTLMEMRSADLFAKAEYAEGNTAIQALRGIASDNGVWLHVGSMVVRVAEDKVANRAVLIAPDGSVRATYDKIHMFDVTIGDGEKYRESRNYRAGRSTVLADLPWGRLGITICYDMRFPHLYGALAQAGASMIAVPSAFTVPTGRAHWHTLLRARAIETQSFVLAAAQVGKHACGRETYGHSLIISPWGEVLADGGGENTGVITADLEFGLIQKARSRVPSLEHRVPFDVQIPDTPADEARQNARQTA